MAAASAIRELAAEKPIVLVEHDIAILDMLADTVHIAMENLRSLVSSPGRKCANWYQPILDGFLPEENVRFRDYQ
jgi:ATP-binding cassette subfamily E protein 1